MKKKIGLLVITLLIISCNGGDDSIVSTDNFNRKKMLTYWANDMIIPAYADFLKKVKNLQTTITNKFTKNPNQTNLNMLRDKWKEAYVTWQKLAPFQIGKSIELNVLQHLNTYPTEFHKIQENIEGGEEQYDLTSINLSGQQGFPAIDYLINGLGKDDTAILQFYKGIDAEKYKDYLIKLADRMVFLVNQVQKDWNVEYKQKFINNDGNTQTSSVPYMVNNYIIDFYEVSIRNAKVEIPSQARDSGTPNPKAVEAYYKKDISRLLLTTAITTAQNFFNGKSFDGSTTGTSLKQYLIFLKRGDLVKSINDQFDEINNSVKKLNPNFIIQINTNNNKMVEVFNKLQKLVKLLKTDMVSAMSIPITNANDNDGD